MKQIKVYVVFNKEPLKAKHITFHKSEAEKNLSKEEEIIEGVALIPLPDDKKIENLLKKSNN